MTEPERLKSVIKYYKMSTNKFAEYIGLKSAQNLYDVLKGRNGISKDLSEKIKASCVNINISWLLTGEGEMLSSTNTNKSKSEVDTTITKETFDLINSQAATIQAQHKMIEKMMLKIQEQEAQQKINTINENIG